METGETERLAAGRCCKAGPVRGPCPIDAWVRASQYQRITTGR